jgi:hypothetical protein
LAKPFERSKIVTDIIVNFDSHTTSLGEFGYLVTPFDGKNFHSNDLVKEGPFDLIVRLLKINFEENSS